MERGESLIGSILITIEEISLLTGGSYEQAAGEYRNALNTLRTQIDVIDHQLIETLGKRMKVADKIGALKKDKNVAILQTRRWNEILGKMILEGEQNQLSEEFVLRIFKAIHQESINHQEKIMNQ